MELQTQGIRLEGTIALTRYGGTGRGAKVSSSPQCRKLVCVCVMGWSAEDRKKRGEEEGAGLSGLRSPGLGHKR